MQTKGASVPDQALAVPVEPVARLDPSGFDPSRDFTEYMLNIICNCEWNDGEIFWHYAKLGERRRFFALCNDFFWWATADGEEITPDTVPLLEQAIADCTAADPVIGDCYAHLLYCARARNMRPQGACYKTIEPQFWPLFDAAGEAREADRGAFGNPVSQASAIEAASAGETRSGSTAGESAVGAAETPKEHGHDQ